jgi:hypothetical protein
MPINKNHEFEDLNGIKCAIVEKNASAERVNFLQGLLEYNKYTVIVVPSPQAAAPAPQPPAGELPAIPAEAPPPTRFTIGVTDVSFNPVNAIFGRMLKTIDGHIVTQAYWQQREAVSRDDVPYYENKS